MSQPNAPKIFEQVLETVKDHPETNDFAYISYVYGNDDLLKLAMGQFRNSVLRGCLKEMFESVKDYGELHGQASVMQAAPWYRFLRMIRNSLSHDMRFHFNGYDLKQLPVSWSSLTIDASMQNQLLQMRDFLSKQKAVQLIDEVIDYVEKHVN